MRITIFGASGSTGRHVVEQAVRAGHTVRVFGRSASRLPDPGEGGETVEGDVFDPTQVARAVEGSDAVVLLLGAPPSDRSGVRGIGTAHVLRAMRPEQRLVCMSCLGVGESYAAQDWFTRRVVLDLWLWRVVADHAVQEALIRESDTSWTIVRPPDLSQAETGETTVFGGKERAPRSSVGRSDLAAFLLGCATSERHLRQAVGVC